MQRITISLEDDLTHNFEHYIQKHGYKNRSEAVRDLIRDRLESERVETKPEGQVVATLTYLYNHHERELSNRLTKTHHHHHSTNVSTLHVHLDHDYCLEVVVLSGTANDVQAVADATISQFGVRQGKLYMLPNPTSAEAAPHSH